MTCTVVILDDHIRIFNDRRANAGTAANATEREKRAYAAHGNWLPTVSKKNTTKKQVI